MRLTKYSFMILLSICLLASCCGNNQIPSDNDIVIAKDYVINTKMSLKDYSSRESLVPQEGCVPNAGVAAKIAEIILNQIYGEENISRQKPFQIGLDDGVWLIEGSFDMEDYSMGGEFHIEIKKSTGEITKIFHTK